MADTEPPTDQQMARYSRQILFDKIGAEGQRRLADARVLLVGCGALGTVLADTLVRAGVGFLRICDRDYVELDNLQRQALFDEGDVAAHLPKAEAAARKLRQINSSVVVEPSVTHVDYTNIARFAEDSHLLLDGTDNFDTRYLINDLAVKTNKPWVYGGAVGATGLCLTVVPHETPCLRCIFDEAPPAELTPTCDTAGVLASTINLVAGLQAVEALKLLIGRSDEINRHLVQIDAWTGRIVNLRVQSARERGQCPCCHGGKFPYLDGQYAGTAVTMCGRNAVQVTPGRTTRLDLAAMVAKLAPVADGPVERNDFMLWVTLEQVEMTLFADGRAIIKGTGSEARAHTLYAKYVGM